MLATHLSRFPRPELASHPEPGPRIAVVLPTFEPFGQFVPVEMALRDNPDLIAARERAQAADFDIDVAGSGRLPRVTVFAGGDTETVGRVIAARSANFLQAFAKIGLVPDTGGTWLLPRLVGRAQALGLALLGDKLAAADAERIGLIWRCVDDAALQEEAQTLAQRLAAMPTQALVATRHALDSAAAMDYEAALAQEAVLQRRLGAAADYREGVAAFTEKRAPQFTDR